MLRLFDQSPKQIHPDAIEAKEFKSPSIQLAVFNQRKELSNYQIQKGLCMGFTDIWLCSHFNEFKNLAEVDRFEKKLMDEMKGRIGDALILLKAEMSRTAHSIANLGATFLSETGKDAISTLSDVYIVPWSLHQDISKRSELFVEGLRCAIRAYPETDTGFINFCFKWVAPHSVDNEVVSAPSTRKVRRIGHSIGIITNPCPGIEILFFDSNFSVTAYPKKEVFYTEMQSLFSRYLGSEGIPVLWCSFDIIEKSLKRVAYDDPRMFVKPPSKDRTNSHTCIKDKTSPAFLQFEWR